MTRRIAQLAAVLAIAASAFAGKTPPWVRAAIPAELPAVKDKGAVVLLDDTVVSVAPDGTFTTRYRRVVKILTAAGGRDYGTVVAWIDHDTKLRAMRAWSIDSAGTEYEVRERDAIETTPTDFELYTDARMKLLSIPAASPGSVVAYEYETADRPYLPQMEWRFQEDVPVVTARYELVLPPGWSYEARWINHAAVQPAGNVWTLSSVAPVPDEPRRPASIAVAGRVGFDILAPGAKALTWNDLGKWYGALAAPRSSATAAVQAKLRDLKASGDPIRAVARFAQRDVRYVAIEIGIGGFQPHAADEIFRNRFGDCKDKATLLRTMLREDGVEVFDVLVNTTRGALEPSYPSLASFNHVISAIRVKDEVAKDLHAVVSHPRLGKLVLFDPTSTVTPFGELPQYLQASRGLLVTPDGGEIIELPAQDPASSQLRRTAKLQLDAAGTLSGTIEEHRTGHIASIMRSMLQPLTDGDRVRFLESTVANHIASYTVSETKIEQLDEPDRELVIRYSIRAPQYAKRVADMLLVRPRVVGQKTEALVDGAKRELSYVTDGPSLHIDEVDIALPATMHVDELPASVEVKTPAVQYTSGSTFKDGVLHYRRRFALNTFVVPREALPDLSKAWTQILGDERASAVFR